MAISHNGAGAIAITVAGSAVRGGALIFLVFAGALIGASVCGLIALLAEAAISVRATSHASAGGGTFLADSAIVLEVVSEDTASRRAGTETGLATG